MVRLCFDASRSCLRMIPWMVFCALFTSAQLRGEDGGQGLGQAPSAQTPAEASEAGVVPEHDEAVLMASVEPSQVDFAETFYLVLTTTRKAGNRLTLPNVLPEKKSVRQAGQITRRFLPLSNRDGGIANVVKEEIRIPFLALDYEDVKTPSFVLTTPDGETIDVPSLPVTMAPLDTGDGGTAGDPTQIELMSARTHHVYDVRDYRPFVVLMTTLFSLFAFLLWHFWLRKVRFFLPQLTVYTPPEETVPAHVRALANLEALLAEGLLQRGEIPIFVTRLMDEVLRDYLSERFSLSAEKRTTKEICEDLLSLSVPGLDVGLSKKIMEDADLVKFARAGLPVETVHQMAGRVRALIEATRAPDEGEGHT